MTTINPKVNYYQPSMQALGQSQVTQNPPAMEGNAVQENPMGSMLFDENFDAKDRRLSLILFAPIYGGLYLLNKLLPSLHGGEYSQSLSGKLASWGDKVSNGRLAQSTVGKAVTNAGAWVKNATKSLVNRSKILSAITKMPTVPENSQVLSMMGGAKEELLRDFKTLVMGNIGKSSSVAEKKAFIKTLQEEFGISYKQLKQLDKFAILSPDKQEKALKLVKDICSKMGSASSANAGRYQQIGNQLKAMTEASSKLGRFLPKALNRGMYGLLMGGGIFMALSAFALAKAIPTTMKAEKGDKFSTFMEEFLSNISWVITMPIGIKLMNAIGGLKNLGMSPARLRKYRQMLKVHNGTNFATKEAWQASADALKALKNKGKVGFFGKIARGIGKFIGAGREVVKPYIKTGANLSNMEKFKNALAKFKFKGGNWIAYPIGLLTYMFIFSPIVDKLFVKASHAVFGKPKHSKYDEKPEVAEEQQQQVQPGANPFATDAIKHDSPTNLLNAYQNGQQYAPENVVQNAANGDNYSYVPSPDGVKVAGQPYSEAHRTYIPSPDAVQIKPQDTTLADQALARADIAEKNAMETLSMKW